MFHTCKIDFGWQRESSLLTNVCLRPLYLKTRLQAWKLTRITIPKVGHWKHVNAILIYWVINCCKSRMINFVDRLCRNCISWSKYLSILLNSHFNGVDFNSTDSLTSLLIEQLEKKKQKSDILKYRPTCTTTENYILALERIEKARANKTAQKRTK